MTALPIQKVWMSKITRDALKEYAWVKRTTMGDVIRAAVDDVRANPGDLSVLSEADEKSQVQVSVKATPEMWADARSSARKVEMSLNSMIRRRIRKILTEEGFM